MRDEEGQRDLHLVAVGWPGWDSVGLDCWSGRALRRYGVGHGLTQGQLLAVGIPTVVDAHHEHRAFGLIDSIEDAVGTAARRPDTRELADQGLTHGARRVDEAAREELDDGRSDLFR